MITRVEMAPDGSIKIPAQALEALFGETDVMRSFQVEAGPHGILLKPCFDDYIEDYTEERIAEFQSGEEALRRILERLKQE